MEKNKRVELLAPVGTKQSLTAALNGGCDAVYFGGKGFDARAFSDTFSDEEIKEIIDCCHLRGVKVRITLNILYKNSEINNVLDFVSMLYQFGADAFIVQDIGLFCIIKKNFPDINLHASTQMTVHNKGGAEYLRNLGFDRVVLSRELSLDEIKKIKNGVDIELECFVHGAICVSYSGRCLMSSVIGGRSGNRGRCAQPCRMKYKLIKNGEKKPVKEGYLLSPKDMAAFSFVDRLIEAGIDTFKVEGRMKSPEYVGEVISVYRKYIDTVYEKGGFKNAVEDKDIKEITQIFNRGGSLGEGYYHSFSGLDMLSSSPKSSGLKIGVVESYNPRNKRCIISLDEAVVCGDGIEIWTKREPHTGTNISKTASKGEKISVKLEGEIRKGDKVYKSYDKTLDDNLKRLYAEDTRKINIKASVRADKKGKFVLRLSLSNIFFQTEDDIVEKAENAPMTAERIIAQLSKTGGTPFCLSFENIKVDEGIYIPVAKLNEIRRRTVDGLSRRIVKSFEREKISVKYNCRIPKKAEKTKLSSCVRTIEQMESCVKFGADRIYFETERCFIDNIDEIVEMCHKKGIEIFSAVPWIERDIYSQQTNDILKMLEKTDIDGYLLRNYTMFETEKKTAVDFTFNIFNSASAEFFGESNDTFCVSAELNIKELEDIAGEKSEIIAYGRLPLMTTHQCPVGLHCGVKKGERFCSMKNHNCNFFIRDRKNVDFPVFTDCTRCFCIIYNSAPIFVLDRFNEIKKTGTGYIRLDFTDEDRKTTEDIVYAYRYMLENQKVDKRTKCLMDKMRGDGNVTKGHFFRGVM